MSGFYVIVELDCNWIFRGPRNSIKIISPEVTGFTLLGAGPITAPTW